MSINISTRKDIEFYFDFGSPTAYLAFTQLPGIAAEAGVALIYKPVLLGGLFQATNNTSPVLVPAKGAYFMQDLARFAKRYAVPLHFNPYFPINTLLLMRIATGLQQRHPEHFLAFVTATYKAIWVDALNAGEVAVVATLLTNIGLDAEAILALASAADTKLRLIAETKLAVERGLFGLPVMYVGDEMFWGQDRLDFVREACQSR